MDPHNKIALKEEKEKGRKRKQERKRNEGGHGRASLERRDLEKSGKQRKERARDKAKEREGKEANECRRRPDPHLPPCLTQQSD